MPSRQPRDDRPLRVCEATTCYPRRPGDPSGSFVADLVHHLVGQDGTTVCVLAPGQAGVPRRETTPGLTVRRLSYFWPRRFQKLAYGDGIPWNLRQSLMAWVNIPIFLAVFAWHLVASACRADIVHAHWGILGALGAILRPLHGRPVVLTVHGSDLAATIAPIRWITKFAIRHCDAVLTPSRSFYDSCRRIRRAGDSCHFVPHGVPCPSRDQIEQRRREAASDPTGCRIVSVGRLIPERRHDLLVRAFARVAGEFPTARLCIVGDGTQMPVLESLAEQLGVADRVTMPGRVMTGEVFDYLHGADLYVSPTTVDNFGTAVVEAAAQALPVVTTRVGFPAELVQDGKSGCVVAADDEDALTEAILAVFRQSPEEMRAMGWAMRDRVIELGLTWDTAAEHVARIFKECVGRTP